MKKTIIILLLFSTLLLFSLTYKEERGKTNQANTINEQIDILLEQMSLKEKIGQMLIIYETHNTVDENVTKLMQNLQPGGIILNRDNITTYHQTKEYIEHLQSESQIPLIISVDQEGGTVQRLQLLKDIKPTFIPNMKQIGKTNNQTLAYQTGQILAKEAETLGINVLYAPVCDIVTDTENTAIGTRSFGATPELVSDMCTALANGIESTGLIATYKHFPGHGSTTTDSHQALPTVNKNMEELTNWDFIPFKKAIQNNAKIIMVGHIALPNITNDLTPASLSRTIITDILKKELNYHGLVITDALNMKALTSNYTEEEIYTKAVEAGVDLLLMPKNPDLAIEVISKNISEERINESVRKILTFKYSYLTKATVTNMGNLNNSSYEQVLNQIPT